MDCPGFSSLYNEVKSLTEPYWSFMLEPTNKQVNYFLVEVKYCKTEQLNKHYWKLCLKHLPWQQLSLTF